MLAVKGGTELLVMTSFTRPFLINIGIASSLFFLFAWELFFQVSVDVIFFFLSDHGTQGAEYSSIL